MKLLLTALNAKYIHTNLAIRYLKNTIEDSRISIDVELAEFTINHTQEYIIQEIYKAQPDVIGFSCYIWNVDMIHKISKILRKVLPKVIIICGGPEVSFEVNKIMECNEAIDFIIMGEGEPTLPKLLDALKENKDYSKINKIAFRDTDKIFVNNSSIQPVKMEDLVFPYGKETINPEKIIYYESSRGCPYNCQYCLSSIFQGVRYRPLELVKKEIRYFIDQGVKQVKFIDRTFNARKDFAMEIMSFILSHSNGKTNFHFEIVAELLDDEMLEFLSTVPVGLFQFEIGVQSTNLETLQIIQRKMNFAKLKRIVSEIDKGANIHQHLDLIVGLPKEDYASFKKSFDDVFYLRPQKLQMGFLKLLKGSGIRENAADYNYDYDKDPPYEVLQNDALSYDDIIRLKGIEEILDIYWNRRMYKNSIDVIIANYFDSPFEFFEKFWFYWDKKGFHHQLHSRNKLYEILLNFYEIYCIKNMGVFREVLKLDYIKHNKVSTLPHFFTLNRDKTFKDRCHKFLQNPKCLQKYLPSYIDLPAKEIIKKVHFENFHFNLADIEENPQLFKTAERGNFVFLFDYNMDSKAIESCKYFVLDNEEF